MDGTVTITDLQLTSLGYPAARSPMELEVVHVLSEYTWLGQ